MKIYILMSIDNRSIEYNDIQIAEYEDKQVHSIHPTRADARSAYSVAKAVGEWSFDDYDIEEYDL